MIQKIKKNKKNPSYKKHLTNKTMNLTIIKYIIQPYILYINKIKNRVK